MRAESCRIAAPIPSTRPGPMNRTAPASLAARMLGIRTINFLPVPLHPGSFAHGLIRDLPDMMPVVTRLPRPVRKWLAWLASGAMVKKAPIFWQYNLGAAAAACGRSAATALAIVDSIAFRVAAAAAEHGDISESD